MTAKYVWDKHWTRTLYLNYLLMSIFLFFCSPDNGPNQVAPEIQSVQLARDALQVISDNQYLSYPITWLIQFTVVAHGMDKWERGIRF